MLRCEGVRKAFGSVRAVDGIDLDEGPGCLAVVGANGAGKSTLLRLAATLLLPDAGRVAVAGYDTALAGDRVRRAMTYLAPQVRLPARLTGREVLAFTAAAFAVHAPERIAALAERFAIGDLLDRRCDGLSTGEHQRLSLARALLPDPQVVLLDEPGSGLDLVAAARLRADLAGLRDARRLIVLASHDPIEIAAVADRVCVVRDGRIAWRGPLAELGGDIAALAGALHRLVAGAAA